MLYESSIYPFANQQISKGHSYSLGFRPGAACLLRSANQIWID